MHLITTSSTILTLAHHGADTAKSNSPTWIQKVCPQIVIASAGFRHTYGHPKKEVFERVSNAVKLGTSEECLRPSVPHDVDYWEGTTGDWTFHLERLYTKCFFNTNLGDITIIWDDVNWECSQDTNGAFMILF